MFRKLLAGLALALAFAVGAARAATPEADALGQQVAHAMLQALPLEQLISDGAKKSMGGGLGIKSRPEWDGYLLDAVTEEVLADRTRIERLLGRSLAREMSQDELKAGLVMMSDPAVQAGMAAEFAKTPAPRRAPGAAADHASRTPAGKAFLADLDKLNVMMTPLAEDFVAEIAPGMFRRFADKVEAGERARRSANP